MNTDKLKEQGDIEKSKSDELDLLAAASLAYDTRMIEKKMADSRVEIQQVNIADIGKDGADHADEPNEEWKQFSEEVFAELRRSH